MLLAIDTTTRNAAVALAEGGQVTAARSWRSAANHTGQLLPSIAGMLQQAGIAPAQLAAVAVALGPGGFSALRAGLSAAKGLAAARRLPIIGIGSLMLEAHPFRDAGMPVCALLEAGRGEAASLLLDAAGHPQRADRIGGAAELLAEITAPTLFCGEGLAPWADAIRQTLGGNAVLCHTAPAGRVLALAALAWQRHQQGDADDLASLQPHYLRMPTIGAPRRRDHTPQASTRRPPAPG